MEHFFKRILLTALVAVGAFSGVAEAACAGTLYFKAPSSWSSIYVVRHHEANLVPATLKNGDYYEIDLATYAPDQGWAGASGFALTSQSAGCGTNVLAVNSMGFNVPEDVCITSSVAISCPGAGNKVYIAEDPLNPGRTYSPEGNVPRASVRTDVPKPSLQLHDRVPCGCRSR